MSRVELDYTSLLPDDSRSILVGEIDRLLGCLGLDFSDVVHEGVFAGQAVNLGINTSPLGVIRSNHLGPVCTSIASVRPGRAPEKLSEGAQGRVGSNVSGEPSPLGANALLAEGLRVIEAWGFCYKPPGRLGLRPDMEDTRV
jgi:hypothetical protein